MGLLGSRFVCSCLANVFSTVLAYPLLKYYSGFIYQTSRQIGVWEKPYLSEIMYRSAAAHINPKAMKFWGGKDSLKIKTPVRKVIVGDRN